MFCHSFIINGTNVTDSYHEGLTNLKLMLKLHGQFIKKSNQTYFLFSLECTSFFVNSKVNFLNFPRYIQNNFENNIITSRANYWLPSNI